MKKTALSFLMLLIGLNSYAQDISPQVVATAGTTYEGTSFLLDWTLGEVAITTIQNDDVQVTQGFHQPYYTITSTRDLHEEIGQVKVYPNPVSNWLEIELLFQQEQEVLLQLFSGQGQLIWTQSLKGQQLSDRKNLEALPAGLYYLHIKEQQQLFSQTIKIQKLQ